MRDEFLSEEDLDLRNLTAEELIAVWQQWLQQAQATNDLDARTYSHGVFELEPDANRAPTRIEGHATARDRDKVRPS